jgi:hypothetical protein
LLRATRLYPHITGEHHPMADLESALVAPPLNLSSTTELQAEIDRLQDAKRRALSRADERAKEANKLRLENERLRARFVDGGLTRELLDPAVRPRSTQWR